MGRFLAVPVISLGLFLIFALPGISSRREATQDGDDVTRSFEKVLRNLRHKVAPSVVAIEVGRSSDPEGMGGSGPVARSRDYYNRPKGPTTGTIIGADGEILTSHFNVSGSILRITVTLPDGSEHEAKILGTDRKRDIALLKIDAKNLPLLPIAGKYRQGDFVAILGRSPNPSTPTINHGILSAVHRRDKTAVQTDAELNYGNVGGPLVNLKGELIGVTCHIRPRAPWGQSGGVGFAIPNSQIKKVLHRLRKGEKIENQKIPWLGIRMGTGDPNREGVQIEQVFPFSPASRAGLQPNDVISEIDGVKISDPEDLRTEIRKREIGDKTTLTVLRGSKERKIELTLEESPS